MKRLSFDGRTGPYIQNAYVRANSILKKAGSVTNATFDYELTKHEIELIEQMSQFPQKVQQAAEEYRPLNVMQTEDGDLCLRSGECLPLVLSCGACAANRR
jgi:arginyl-tRNA synthetase